MSYTEISVGDASHKPYIVTPSENADKHPQSLSTPLSLIPGSESPAAPVEKPPGDGGSSLLRSLAANPPGVELPWELPASIPPRVLLHAQHLEQADRRRGCSQHPGRAEARTPLGDLCGVKLSSDGICSCSTIPAATAALMLLLDLSLGSLFFFFFLVQGSL